MNIDIHWDTYHTNDIKEKYLFRFLDVYRLIDFLESGSLYFARMDGFDDKFEGISVYDIIRTIAWSQIWEGHPDLNKSIPEKEWEKIFKSRRNNLIEIKENQKQRQKRHFVNCWYRLFKEIDNIEKR